MNKFFCIIFAVLTTTILLSSSVSAQSGREGHKQFDKATFLATKNAYIIAEVGLTPEEAAIFIPLCNELQDKKYELDRSCRKYIRNIKGKKDITASEYSQAVECRLDSQIKMANLEKEYYDKFKTILTPEKLYKYQCAEMKFAHDFMQKRRERIKK